MIELTEEAAAKAAAGRAAAAATVVVGQAVAAATVSAALKAAEGPQGTLEVQGPLCRKAQAAVKHLKAGHSGTGRWWCRSLSQLRSAGTNRSAMGKTEPANAEGQEGVGLAKVEKSGRRGESRWRGDPRPRPSQKK